MRYRTGGPGRGLARWLVHTKVCSAGFGFWFAWDVPDYGGGFIFLHCGFEQALRLQARFIVGIRWGKGRSMGVSSDLILLKLDWQAPSSRMVRDELVALDGVLSSYGI